MTAITPLISSSFWRASLRYDTDAKRNAFLSLGMKRYEKLVAAVGEDEGGSEIALHEAYEGIADDIASIDEEIEKVPEDRSDWPRKPYAKSIAYEYLQKFELTDDELTYLMRVFAEKLAHDIVDASPSVTPEEWADEIAYLSDQIFMGALVQQAMLDAIGISETAAKLAALGRAAGKDEERVVFEAFLPRMAASIDVGGEKLDEIERAAYLYFIENKEPVINASRAARKLIATKEGSCDPDAYYAEHALSLLGVGLDE